MMYKNNELLKVLCPFEKGCPAKSACEHGEKEQMYECLLANTRSGGCAGFHRVPCRLGVTLLVTMNIITVLCKCIDYTDMFN